MKQIKTFKELRDYPVMALIFIEGKPNVLSKKGCTYFHDHKYIEFKHFDRDYMHNRVFVERIRIYEHDFNDLKFEVM